MESQTFKIVRSVAFLIIGTILFISVLRENKPYIIYDYAKYAVSLFTVGYAIWNFIDIFNDDEQSDQ